ncbi:MAG: MFS transporter, partial [Armatimonadota bacterium]
MLYATRVLIGLGASGMFLSVIKEIDIRFSIKNFSVLFSLALFVGYCGGLLGTRPLASVVSAFGWRTPLLAIGIACGIFCILTAALMKSTYLEIPRQSGSSVLPAIKRIALNKLSYPIVYNMMIISLNYFVMQAIIGKKFLQDCCGFSSGRAASYTLLLMLMFIAMSFLSGVFTGLIGNLRKPIIVALGIMATIAPITGLFILSKGNAWILPCYVVFGVASGGTTVYVASMKELNEPKFAASAVGFSNSSTCVGIAVFATLAGRVLDSFSSQAVRTATAIQYPPAAYKTIFIGMAALAASALIS